jgi:hypothetical protein
MESTFKRALIRELYRMFPDCVILKNDPAYVQGIPDLIILWGDQWAALECKDSKYAPHRPNQDYHIEKMKSMSFAAFIHPGNKEQVLNDLQLSFGSCGAARVPGS